MQQEKVNLLLFGDNLGENHPIRDHSSAESNSKKKAVALGPFVRKLKPWIRDAETFVQRVLKSSCDAFPSSLGLSGIGRSPGVESIVLILEAMAKCNVLAFVSEGCSIFKIESTPRLLAEECMGIIEKDALASQFLQCGILCEAKLGLIATDIFGASLSRISIKNTKQSSTDHFRSDVTVRAFQTDAFDSKLSCLKISSMVSKYITILRDGTWNMPGRFMIFGFSCAVDSYVTLDDVYSNIHYEEGADAPAEMTVWMEDMRKLLLVDPFFSQLLTTCTSKSGYQVPALHFDDGRCGASSSRSFFVTFTFNSKLDKLVGPELSKLFRKMKRRWEFVRETKRGARANHQKTDNIDVYGCDPQYRMVTLNSSWNTKVMIVFSIPVGTLFPSFSSVIAIYRIYYMQADPPVAEAKVVVNLFGAEEDVEDMELVSVLCCRAFFLVMVLCVDNTTVCTVVLCGIVLICVCQHI